MNSTLESFSENLTTGELGSIGISFLTLLINIWQSFKLGHFKSSCRHSTGETCCEIELEESDSENK